MDITNYKIKECKNSKTTNNKYIIAGPCSFGSFDEIYSIAKELKKLGVEYLRAGAFKPRTSPYSFQGLHEEGIEILIKVKKLTGLKIVTELFNIDQVRKYGDLIDIIQIGSRNMYNYDFLNKLGFTNHTIILKRGISATIEEWLNSAEYIAMNGNENIILCERGIRGFDSATRNVLDLQSVVLVKKLTPLPVIVDPSHASGIRELVIPMSLAANACGADGLIIECHNFPDESLTDSSQTISIEDLKLLLSKLKDN